MKIHCTYTGIRGCVTLSHLSHSYSTMVQKTAEERVNILEYWKKHRTAATVDAFGVSERTLFSWKAKLCA